MNYDLAARQRLGREVRAARVNAGYSNREAFAAQIGRSARQVQALEKGESGVGPDTMHAAAELLGWPIERVYELLDGNQPGPTSPALTSVSDEDLAAEVLRRMKAGGEHGGDTAATKAPGSGPDNVTPMRSAPDMQTMQTEAARRDDD